MFNARLYYDTGFNAVNIPFDTDVLTNAATQIQEFPTMDIITNMFLTAVSVKIPAPMDFMVLGHADYMEIYDDKSSAFYSITDMIPTSADVVRFNILIDPMLTFNVISKMQYGTDGDEKLKFTGFIERTTAIKDYEADYDVNSTMILEDPLLVPLLAPQHFIYSIFDPVAYKSSFLSSGGTYRNWDSGEDTIDIYGSSYLNYINESDLAAATAPVKITGTAGENYDVTFTENFNSTRYSIGKPRTEKTYMTIGNVTREYPGITFYGTVRNANERYDPPNVLETAQTYYNFGIPNPIAVSYQIPVAFLAKTALDPTGYAIAGYKDGVFSLISGVSASFTLEKSVYQFESIENDRDLTPIPLNEQYIEELCRAVALKMKFKLIAAGTGQEAVISINDLDITNSEYEPLKVNLITDPSPNGAPYYAWETRYNTFDYPTEASVAKPLLETLYGAVRGSTWQPAPVSMSNFGAQSDLNGLAVRNAYAIGQRQVAYDAAQQQLRLQNENVNAANINDLMNLPGSLVGSIAGSEHFEGAAIAIGGIGSSLATSAIQRQNALQSSAYSAVYANMQRSLAINQEMEAFNVSHQANVTTLMFPVSQTMPLFTGNGAVIDIEAPNQDDIRRYIEIMEYYGIYTNLFFGGHNLIPAKADINNYCFIKTRGLNISGNGLLTKTAAESVEGALNAGVRIWTKKPFYAPDHQIYKQEATS